MPRPKLTLADHLDNEELKRRYRSSRNVKEARRWHALWLISEGATSKEAARMLGLAVSWVRQLIHRYNCEGPQSVADRHRVNPGGAPPRLDSNQREKLNEILCNPPESGGVWSGSKVAKLIQELTGKKTYPQLGWVYLRDLDKDQKIARRRRRKGG